VLCTRLHASFKAWCIKWPAERGYDKMVSVESGSSPRGYESVNWAVRMFRQMVIMISIRDPVKVVTLGVLCSLVLLMYFVVHLAG